VISIGVDIGGTFTDVVALDRASGRYSFVKVPTTPGHLSDGVRAGTLAALERANRRVQDVERFVHGTTVATNAVLERTGARTAIIATEGFEDTLEIGRLKRSRLYDLEIDAETPVFLSRRRHRRGVRERVGADGSVVTALDEQQARAVIEELRDHEDGIEGVAVSLLFSFRNPVHERRLRAMIEEIAPHLAVSLSCEVDPTFREYERTVTTAFDAYLRPVVGSYLEGLRAELAQIGVGTSVQVMQSRGGIASAEIVADKPVTTLLSGPAAGAVGSRFIADRAGHPNVITIDVGGTSADVCLIREGKPLIATNGQIDRYPLRVPMVDVHTIGAGGGSVAWLDAAGGFHVGPRSAGAVPGPACYMRGGTEATATDASVVLGYVGPENFAGGTMGLDVEAAHAVIDRLARKRGMTVHDAAAGIHRILNAKMADAVRLVSIERGHDPRDFALVPLGGAGPLHAGRLAEELAIPRLVVPPMPGVLSALGLLVASIEHDRTETVAWHADTATAAEVDAVFGRLEAEVARQMAAEGVPSGAATTLRAADMRYLGQSHALEVAMPSGSPNGDGSVGALVERFHEVYERLYGYADGSAPVEIVNLRVVQSSGFEEPRLDHSEAASESASSTRSAYFEEYGEYLDVPVLTRSALVAHGPLAGPAIVEQPDTTLVVYPGHTATLDDFGNVIVTIPGAAA
jgi:N-methylhydantoinase A